MLEVQDLSVFIGGKTIVDKISFKLKENEIFTILGPNGAGKTMLIKAIMQIVPYRGKVLLKDQDVSKINTRQLATQIGVLSQQRNIAFDYNVRQVVELGRYCHSNGLFSSLNHDDKILIEQAMVMTGVKEFEDRSILTLSGGELQRVFLAQLFAQDPKIIILDEPTNHLDLQYQIEIFELVKKWVQQGDRSVIAVIHDLNFVYAYSNRSLLLKKGTGYAIGEKSQVLTPENLHAVYNIDVSDWMKKLTVHWR
jgi:iron complex transport system ATP-binding protein